MCLLATELESCLGLLSWAWVELSNGVKIYNVCFLPLLLKNISPNDLPAHKVVHDNLLWQNRNIQIQKQMYIRKNIPVEEVGVFKASTLRYAHSDDRPKTGSSGVNKKLDKSRSHLIGIAKDIKWSRWKSTAVPIYTLPKSVNLF